MAIENLAKDLENYDKLFSKWQKTHPNGTFSQFSVQRIAAAINKGSAHTTLGPNLNQGKTWWKDGEKQFHDIIARYKWVKNTSEAAKTLRFCDYGCGSLRVSAHLIKRQNPGCVVGLDLTEDFIKHGKKLLGDLIEEKQVVTGTIEDKLDHAVNMNVDVLFSNNVSSHIHPNENTIYYDNIKQITHKAGSLAMVHALVSPEPVRFQRSGWAWPLEHYIASMNPMGLVQDHVGDDFERNGHTLSLRVLSFERQ